MEKIGPHLALGARDGALAALAIEGVVGVRLDFVVESGGGPWGCEEVEITHMFLLSSVCP